MKKHTTTEDIKLPMLSRMRRIISNTGPERTPDFFVIGAEKCGTTWLWDMFRDHPEVGVPRPKELRYFSNLHIGTGLNNFQELRRLLNRPFDRHLPADMIEPLVNELRISAGTDAAYLRIFGALDGKVVGDVSPQYCMLPDEGLAHLKMVAPAAKIILLLRDPVERLISAAKMKASEKFENLDDDIIREKAFIPFQINMSRYSLMIDRFEREFSDSVFIGFMDDIRERPLELLADVCNFLGVTHRQEYYPNISKRSNEGKSYRVNDALVAEVYSVLLDEYENLERIFPERVHKWREKYASLSGC